MDFNFLNTVNRTIGENMRFAKNYKPGQAKAAETAQGPQDLMQLFQPFFLLMLLAMMGGQGGQLPHEQLPPPVTPLPKPSEDPAKPKNPAQEWLSKNLDGQATGQSLAEKLKGALTEKTFNHGQLGEAMMGLVHKADESQAGKVLDAWEVLVKSGELNPLPFLREGYLTRLTPERRQALATSITDAGLLFDSGKPNTALMGHLLSNVNAEQFPHSQALAKNVLDKFSTQLAVTGTGAAAGKAVQHLLQLAQWPMAAA